MGATLGVSGYASSTPLVNMRQLIAAQDWREGAACRGMDPDLFYPRSGGNMAATHAKATCEQCPSRLPCRDYAIRYEAKGVWGGTTENERARIRGHRRYLG